MSGRPRSEHRRRIRDLGTRRIQEIGGNGTRGTSHPAQLRDTDFPSELGEEVRVFYDPETNELIHRPKEE